MKIIDRIGFWELLQIILIVLKLTNLITINWWWVFAPTFISIGLCFLFVLLYILVILINILHK